MGYAVATDLIPRDYHDSPDISTAVENGVVIALFSLRPEFKTNSIWTYTALFLAPMIRTSKQRYREALGAVERISR